MDYNKIRMPHPDHPKLPDAELLRGLAEQVRMQKETPFDKWTGAIINLTNKAHSSSTQVFKEAVDTYGDAEKILAGMEQWGAALLGTKKAREITLEGRPEHEDALRSIMSAEYALIRALEASFAGLKSGRMTPEDCYTALENILQSRDDAVSQHLQKLGKDAIVKMLTQAKNRSYKLDTILDKAFTPAAKIEGAIVASARRIVKALMQQLRAAVIGISEDALKGYGSAPSQEDERDFGDNAKFLAYVERTIAEGDGILVGIAGECIYCHASRPDALAKVRTFLTDPDDAHGGIGVYLYTSHLGKLLEELRPDHALTVQLPAGGSTEIRRNTTPPHAIDARCLKALGVDSEEELLRNTPKYCYEPVDIPQST